MTPAPTLEQHLRPAASSAGRHASAVIAAFAHGESATFCRGYTDRTGTTPVTDRTRFEIGSVTKTFTALLLADLAARGLTRLDEPISNHIPPGTLPATAHPITFEHLATHTAGLPRLPPGLLRSAVPSWYSNPYETYSPERLLPSLARTRPRHRPGTRVRYSNFGMGVLGHLLAQITGTDYGTLLHAHVLEPLGLADTTHDPFRSQATGYWHNRPRPPWTIPALPGAGVLRSTARDLLQYLRHLIDHPAPHPLHHALDEVLLCKPRTPGGPSVCLGWSRHELTDCTIFFHAGATRGFTAFVGFTLRAAAAVVALTNTAPTLRGAFIQSAYDLLGNLAAPVSPTSPRACRGRA